MKKIYALLIIVSCIFSVTSYAQCTTPATVPYFEGI